MKYKTFKGDQFDLDPAMVPHLRALVQLCDPSIGVSQVKQLSVVRQPKEGEILGSKVSVTLLREVELSEQELADIILSGQFPAIHGVEEE